MKNLVCFLEEYSAKALLEGVLPRLLPPHISCHYIVFEGKQDMKRQLLRRLRGWLMPDSTYLVIMDQDSADCVDVKNQLMDLCREAGKPEAVVRIACHELESFYFGDLSAVEKGLGLENGIAQQQKKAKYRIPDNIINPSKELEKITDRVYQKIGGSREIGKIISLDNNTSHSFTMMICGIKKACGI